MSVILVPVAARGSVAANDREVEVGVRLWGRGDGLFVADWPLYSLVALAVALVGALAVVLWRRTPRVYQLHPTDVVKSP